MSLFLARREPKALTWGIYHWMISSWYYGNKNIFQWCQHRFADKLKKRFVDGQFNSLIACHLIAWMVGFTLFLFRTGNVIFQERPRLKCSYFDTFQRKRSRRLTLTYLQSGGGKMSFRTHAQRLISDTAAILCTSGSSHWDQTSIDSDIMSVHWGINISVNWTTQPKSITTWWRAPAWRRSITSTWGWGSCRENRTSSAQYTSFLT